MEAVAAGCLPLVPDRLAYREYYPEACRYASCPEDPQREAASAAARLLEFVAGERPPRSPDFSGLALPALRAEYSAVLERLAAGAG